MTCLEFSVTMDIVVKLINFIIHAGVTYLHFILQCCMKKSGTNPNHYKFKRKIHLWSIIIHVGRNASVFAG